MTDNAARAFAAIASAAAGRMSAERLEVAVDGIAPDRFVDEDGNLDQGRIARLVEVYAEKPNARAPDLGPGRRPGSGSAGRDRGIAEAEHRFGLDRPGAFSQARPAPGQY